MSIDHLLIAKDYYERACEDFRVRGPMSAGFAVSALQDAVEMALVGLASKLGTKIESSFDTLWSSVDAASPPGKKLGYRAQMQSLNKARLNFKHFGNLPDVNQSERFRANAEAFLEDISAQYFDVRWEDVSELDLLGGEPEKAHLGRARACVSANELHPALQACADALASVRDKQSLLVGHGIAVQFTNVPQSVRDEILLQVGNLRRRVDLISDVAFGSLLGVNVLDLRMIEAYLPQKVGTEYRWNADRLFPILPKHAWRCIQVITRYAIATERHLNAGSHPDWSPI